MNYLPSYNPHRSHSSQGKRSSPGERSKTLDTKVNSYNGRVKMQITKNNGSPFIDYLKDHGSDHNAKSRELFNNVNLEKFADKHQVIEAELDRAIHSDGLPFKVDFKLYMRLKTLGINIPQGLNEKNLKPLQDFLRRESSKFGSPTTGKKGDSSDEKNILTQSRDLRQSYKKPAVQKYDVAIEGRLNWGVKERKEREEREKEAKEREALRKSLVVTSTNSHVNGLTLCVLGNGSHDEQRDSKKSLDIMIQLLQEKSYKRNPGTQNIKEAAITLVNTVEGEPNTRYNERDHPISVRRLDETVQDLPSQPRRLESRPGSSRAHKFHSLERTNDISPNRATIPSPHVLQEGDDPYIEPHFHDNAKTSFSPLRRNSRMVKAELDTISPSNFQVKPVKLSGGEMKISRPVTANNTRVNNVAFWKVRRFQNSIELAKSIEVQEMHLRDRMTVSPTTIRTGSIDHHCQSPSFSEALQSSITKFAPPTANTNSTHFTVSFKPNIIGITGTRINCRSPPKQTPGVLKSQPSPVRGGRSNSISAALKLKRHSNSISSNFAETNLSGGMSALQIVSTTPPIATKPIHPRCNALKIASAADKAVPVQPNIYKYYLGKGNNVGLVKRVLASRSWWEETKVYDQGFSLKWQQTSKGYKFERLFANPTRKQLVNHFEFHREISTKNGLIRSLSSYCETNKMYLSEITPTTFVFNMDDEANFDTDMQRFARFFIKHCPNQSLYPKPDPNDKRNADVWYNFDYRKKGKYNPPHLDADNKALSPYLQPKMSKTFSNGITTWVLKPTGLNRGRGIELFNSLESLNELMIQYFSRVTETKKKDEKEGSGSEDSDEEQDDKKKRGTIIKSRTFVVQKYIERLFLVNNRKFDIRVWALVTHDMQLYFFKEGYLRTCSEEYTLNEDNILNKFVHLTNNAIQKHGENYGNHESGNQLSFKDLEEYAKKHNVPMDFQGQVLPRMKELVNISMQSVKKTINLNDRKFCFEVFGYDFMIDSEFKVWLIEVNTNPCIEESSPLLQQLLPRMIDDAFKLTVDVIFPKPDIESKFKPPLVKIEKPRAFPIVPKKQKDDDDEDDSEASVSEAESESVAEEESPEETPKTVVFSVDGYSDDENMWEHLGSMQYQKPISKRDKQKNGV